MARTFGSWLSGPPQPEAGDPSAGPNEYPGQQLGLPPSGSGSLVGWGRRMGALAIDYLIGMGLGGLTITLGLLTTTEYQYQWHGSPGLIAWIVLGAVSVRLFSFTPGQYLLGSKVASVDHREHVGLGRSTLRILLIALVVPPLFTDTDGRGLQDKATGTAIVRR